MVDFPKRDLLKLSGLAGGAVALGSGLGGCGLGSTANAATDKVSVCLAHSLRSV